MRATEFLTELWTQPYPLESRAIGAADREYHFTTIDDRRGRIVFDSMLDSDQGGTHLLFVVVHFYIDDEYHDTGKGDAIKIFSTVATACKDYITKYKPPIIVFETESRKKRQLYLRMTQALTNYEIYPNWYKDRELGQEIDNASVNGIREETIVLRLRNYDPKKTRAYVEGVAEDQVNELYEPETSFPLNWYPSHDPNEASARAYDRNKGYIDIKFTPILDADDMVEVEFSRNDSYDMTGGGDANRVLATVLQAFREYLKGYQPKILIFSAKGGSRSKIYQSLIKRFAAGVGYKQFDTKKLSPETQERLAFGGDVMVLRKMNNAS